MTEIKSGIAGEIASKYLELLQPCCRDLDCAHYYMERVPVTSYLGTPTFWREYAAKRSNWHFWHGTDVYGVSVAARLYV